MASPAAIEPSSESAATGSDFRIVPWASCQPSPLNPRKHFDRAALQELAGTMGSDVGVIEPLVVRPTKNKGQFEIIAGERRWRAADLAGLQVVPVIVREGLTDVQVLRMMVIENKQRQDLNALEEGEGFYQLTKRGVDIDTIAGDIKASRKYVYDRIKLRDLVPVGQELLVAGRITAGHAILIARLAADQQSRVLDPAGDSPLFENEGGELTREQVIAEEEAEKKDPYVGQKTRTVRELDGWIARHCRFDPKSAVNRELYSETAAAVEHAGKFVQITYNTQTHPDAKEGNKQRIYHAASWKRADGQPEFTWHGSKPKPTKTCDRSVLGVVVAGRGRGQAFQVCVNKDCDVHWKAERQAREKAAQRAQRGSASKADGSAEKRAADQRRRQEEEARKREEEREIRAAALRLAIGRVADTATKVEPYVVLRAISEIFCGDADDDGFEQHFRLKPGSVRHYGNGTSKALEALKPGDLVRALTWAAVSSETTCLSDSKIEAFFKSLKVDLRACEQEIRDARTLAVQTSAQPKKKSAKASKKR